jgi:hypothetical protein
MNRPPESEHLQGIHPGSVLGDIGDGNSNMVRANPGANQRRPRSHDFMVAAEDGRRRVYRGGGSFELAAAHRGQLAILRTDTPSSNSQPAWNCLRAHFRPGSILLWHLTEVPSMNRIILSGWMDQLNLLGLRVDKRRALMFAQSYPTPSLWLCFE